MFICYVTVTPFLFFHLLCSALVNSSNISCAVCSKSAQSKDTERCGKRDTGKVRPWYGQATRGEPITTEACIESNISHEICKTCSKCRASKTSFKRFRQFWERTVSCGRSKLSVPGIHSCLNIFIAFKM